MKNIIVLDFDEVREQKTTEKDAFMKDVWLKLLRGAIEEIRKSKTIIVTYSEASGAADAQWFRMCKLLKENEIVVDKVMPKRCIKKSWKSYKGNAEKLFKKIERENERMKRGDAKA